MDLFSHNANRSLRWALALFLASSAVPSFAAHEDVLVQARAIALTYLNTGLSATDGDGAKATLTKVRTALLSARVNTPPDGQDWDYCDANPGDLAFTKFTGDSPIAIYLCDAAFSGTPEDLAQILIHESTHYGVLLRDECATSRVEITAITLAGYKPFKNAYIDHCHLNDAASFIGLGDPAQRLAVPSSPVNISTTEATDH